MVGERIRVFCVDDHEETSGFYRIALEFESDMKLVGSLPSTEGLLLAVEATRPSVLLLDLVIPGCDALAALEKLRARFPDLVILVVSGLEESDVVAEAFRRGASGFFLKTMDLRGLTSVIRRAAAGERVNTGPKTRSVGGPTLGGESHP
jgi:DNA-binding NarL/FixJ family response regulator